MTLAGDVRYALRNMRLHPGFTFTAVFVLALGIAANTAIFTVVHAVLLRPLPYADPGRLVRLYERNVAGESAYNVVSPANLLDWQREATSYAEMAAWGEWSINLGGDGGSLPERVWALIGTHNLLTTLGVQPALGRSFLPEDDRPEASRVVLLSNGLWQRRFGSNPGILGSVIRIDGEPHQVIGILPAGFDFPSAEWQVWLPLWRVLPPEMRQNRGSHQLNVLGRLRPGVSVPQAEAELDGIARRIRQRHPSELTGTGATVAALHERLVVRVRTLLLVLLGAVGCVLLVACVNVTNLLLARAVARRSEVAIRAALGAGRGRLVRQFLVESLLLAGMAAALGLLLAHWGTGLLVATGTDIPRLAGVRVSPSVLVFIAVAAVLTGLLAGLAPALWSSGPDLVSAIHKGGRSRSGGHGRRRFQDALVCTEVAASLVLLVATGLLLKSFARLRAVDPGFAPERLLTMRFSLPQARYGTPAQRTAFLEGLLENVQALPGVTAAGLVTSLPLAGHFMDNTFTIEGRPPLPPGQFLDALLRSADPNYFRAMGISLRRGRSFTGSERLDSAGKAVVSESFVKAFLPTEEPLGRRINLGNGRVYEMVGVVGDVRKHLAERPEPTMYFPIFEGRFHQASLVVRTEGQPNALATPVRREIARLDSELAVFSILTMEELLSGAAGPRRFSLSLLGIFALLAVVLAAVGLYGVLSFATEQLTGEIGIRMALGAGSTQVLRLVLARGLKPAITGIALGVAAGLAAMRVLESLLFEVSPSDAHVFLAVPVLLAAVCLAACAIPARRAARMDPARALRAE